MTPEQAVDKLNIVLAHLWMIRTYLKHADDIQDDEELLDVPRTLYDSIRAVEPAFLRKDYDTYLRRLKGKIPKLRRLAEFFAKEYRRVSTHTNFEMASLSLTGSVQQMEAIFAELQSTNPSKPLEAMEDEKTETSEPEKNENSIITD